MKRQLLAVAVAFTVAGFGSVIAAFSVFAGAIALAVGFAMQDLLANFVAGVFILKDRPFEVGDWIEWVDGEGRVEEIDLRVTRVRTFDNELVTVPNGTLANDAVTNPVAYDKLRQAIVFGIGYSALYKADNERDPDQEAELAGVPTRFVSLMGVSFGSVAILAVVFAAPETFLEEGLLDGHASWTAVATTLKAVTVGAIFSVVGAATADSVF